MITSIVYDPASLQYCYTNGRTTETAAADPEAISPHFYAWQAARQFTELAGMAARLWKAANIVANGLISRPDEPTAAHMATVQSSPKGTKYPISAYIDERGRVISYICPCPDYRAPVRRGQKLCKHITAVMIEDHMNERSQTTPAEQAARREAELDRITKEAEAEEAARQKQEAAEADNRELRRDAREATQRQRLQAAIHEAEKSRERYNESQYGQRRRAIMQYANGRLTPEAMAAARNGREAKRHPNKAGEALEAIEAAMLEGATPEEISRIRERYNVSSPAAEKQSIDDINADLFS